MEQRASICRAYPRKTGTNRELISSFKAYKAPLREVPKGVAQERNPSIQHLTVCGQIKCTWSGGSENYVLVRSSRSGVWGGALPGMVRSLAVVVENRK